MVSSAAAADCLVIGDGLIGLSTALELGRRTKVVVVGGPCQGSASTAAASLLIPAFDRLPASARPFFADSLDRYPALIDELRRFDRDLRLIPGIIEHTSDR